MIFTKTWKFLVLSIVVCKILQVIANENRAFPTPGKDAQLVFDITNHTEDIVSNFCNPNATFQFEKQWRLSSSFYLWMSHRGQSSSGQPKHPVTKLIFDLFQHIDVNSTHPLNYTMDIGLFTNIEHLCDNTNLSRLAEADVPAQVAMRFTSSSSKCQTMCVPLALTYNVFKLENISFGLDIDQRLFECLTQACQSILRDVKFIVLNTELESVTNTLSYGGFGRKMDSILVTNYDAWKRQNPTGLFYIRISIKKTLAIERNKEGYVKTFVEQFATAWLQNRTNVSIILETYKSPPEKKLRVRHTEVAIPHINFNPDLDYANYALNAGNVEWNDFPSTCEVWQAIKTANPVFKTYLMQVPNWNSTLQLIQECPAIKYLLNNTFIFVNGSESQTFLQNISSKNGNSKMISLLNFLQPDANDTSGTYYNVLNAGARLKTEQNDSSDSCQQQKQSSTRTIKLNKYYAEESDSFGPLDFHLSYILLESDYIKRRYSGGFNNRTFWIDFRITDMTRTSREDLKHVYRHNLYCSEALQKVKESHEALINWAKIHDIIVTPFSLIDTLSRTGWWYRVATVPQLNWSLTNFSVLVRRNVPPSLDPDFTNGPFTYPCLSVSSNSVRDINLKNSSFAGISVNFDSLSNFTTLSENHVRALLFIALSRFKVVHIKASRSTAKMMINVLNTNFAEKLPQKIGKTAEDTNLFLEYDATDLSNLKELLDVRFPLAGLHVSGCESEAQCQNAKLVSSLQKTTLKYEIGILIDGCIDAINGGLDRIRNHPLFNVSSQIVCHGSKGVLIPDYFEAQDELQLYLDTTLYVQQYFSFHFNKTTYWKFSFDNLCTDPESVMGYLRFMNAFSQYADGYKINYFLGDAFVNCSWWHVDNYNDLLNASTYVERATGERATGALIDDLVPLSPPLSLVISLSVVSLLLFTAICGLYAYHRLKTKKLLSKQEVNAFVNGEEIEVNTEVIGLQHVQVHTTRSLGFNKAFEIHKRNIILGRLIGNGNFGQVFEGTLNDGQKVAIKQPKPDCSKEVFKTMLSETKVLSYLGEHENVVKFIGAYTREIDMGMIYIVTELCENGTLENHLYQRRIKQYEPAVSVSPDYVGYVTCPTIVACSSQNDQGSIVAELCRISMEIASGMNYIAERKIVHSDLSARNVLMNRNRVCKIADFGLSRKLYESGIYKKKGEEGLPWRWMAIESLKNMEFTTKSDVWSYAVTLWEIFSLGETPYAQVGWDHTFTSRLEAGTRIPKPQFASDEIYEKMLSCWNLVSEDRPTFLELFEFFKDLGTIPT